MMHFSIYTLGCKVNQYETQAMEQLLTQRGHVERSWDEPCDAYIINTCTVTAVSDKKSRNMIRRVRRQNPAAVVAVCGCYAQVKPEAVEALDVDVVAGTGGRVAFLDAVEAAVSEKRRSFAVDDALRRRTFEVLPAGGMAERTRAMLKVQDGCSNFCTYCIIPYARGPVRSLPLEEAVAQAREVAQAGYREMVVTGIEISSWGRDLPEKPPLWKLLSAICASAPAVRVRLGSLEPRTVDEDFCQALRGFKISAPSSPELTERQRHGAKAHAPAVLHGAVFGERRPFAPVFPRLRRHHRPHRGLPRGDRGGIPGEPGLFKNLRLFQGARVPLLPPRRHPRGQDARPAHQ